MFLNRINFVINLFSSIKLAKSGMRLIHCANTRVINSFSHLRTVGSFCPRKVDVDLVEGGCVSLFVSFLRAANSVLILP